MVYHNKLVAAVKVDGKILRESGSSVQIPFGSEYSLLLKNLNSVRVVVNVNIDGKDAFDGTEIIIEPNSSVELERFIRNRNFKSGNKFKFIERTKEIEKHRGVDACDGLIRIEYKTEKVEKQIDVTRYNYHDVYVPVVRPCFPRPQWTPIWYESPTFMCGMQNSGLSSGPTITNTSSSGLLRSANGAQGNVQCAAMNAVQEQGITVPGSKSEQSFSQGSWFPTHQQTDVIVLELKGTNVRGEKVSEPITVQKKSLCTSCGKTNKATSKFCNRCGTGLEIL